jgi:hypothetical protein
MLFGAIGAFRSTPQPVLPEHALHASATHGSDNFAIATGAVADGVEGIFFLDFLTGEITCSVLNARTGLIGGMFKHNVVADLGVERGKKPSYLMVTGRAAFRVRAGGFRPADSLVYVVDSNTGNYAAYGLPWSNQIATQVGNQGIMPMKLIGKGKARAIDIQE